MNSSLPKVSIVIPCRNEEKYIEKCLESVVANDYPGDQVEILVVDGRSEDRTREIVRTFAEKYSTVRLLDNARKTTPVGLNIGIKEAKGEAVIIMGTHAAYNPDYVSNCVRSLAVTGADCVGGVCATRPRKETRIAKAIAFALSSPFGVGNAYFRIGIKKSREVDTVPFGCYRRKTLDRIGLFDEELVRCQDDELNYRLREKGGRIVVIPEIRSRYYARSSLSGLWDQYFWYGFWKVRVFQKHPRMMQLRQFTPSAFVLALVIALLVGVFYPVVLSVFGAVVFSYVAGSIFFSFRVAKQQGSGYFGIMPIVFLCIHVAYGLGFLIGLVRFVGRWGKSS